MLQLTSTIVVLSALLIMSGCQRETSAVTVAPGTESQVARHSIDGDQENSGDTAIRSDTNPHSLTSTRPFSIVMYDSANEELVRPHAERIANLIGTKIVQASPRNPVCCVWIEITGWTPNPGNRGYIINNQPGGSIIQASDADQLRLAVDRFESAATRYDDHVELPTGLLTNYNVNTEPLATEQSDAHARETSAQSVPKSESTPRSP